MGEHVHRTVAALLEAGVRAPSAQELFAFVGASPVLAGRPASDKSAASQRLLVATALYFRYFAPEPRWRLHASELRGDGCRFDLVFADRRSRVRVDELKSGRVDDAANSRSLQEQVASQLRAGTERWGDHFSGVRVLLLATPRRSYLACPDGSTRPLTRR